MSQDNLPTLVEIPRFRDLHHIRAVQLSRSGRWHPGGLEEWSVSDWACAMAGEAGEVCNAVKKYNRLLTGAMSTTGPQTLEQAVADIAKEIGDTLAYLDLLAARLGIDTARAFAETFNRISVREGFPERIEIPPAPSTAITKEQ